MLNYSELTVVKNADGVPSALGYPINSFLLENNKPLFISSGGGKKHKKSSKKHQKNDKVGQLEETDGSDYADDHDYDSLAVPAGLICMTETICRSPTEMYKNENDNDNDNEDTVQLIPEGLYEKLLALAEHKQPSKKYSRKKEIKSVGNKKNKTNKTNKSKKQSKK